MKTFSFKSKIIVLFIAIISVSITTSYLSANFYISGYISENDTTTIQSRLSLIKNNLVQNIHNKIELAKNTKFSIVQIGNVVENTGFADIIKISYDLVFDKNGGINDKDIVEDYLSQLQSAGDRIIISDIFYRKDTPLISILVPQRQPKRRYFSSRLKQH